jgi:hypothetical protein
LHLGLRQLFLLDYFAGVTHTAAFLHNFVAFGKASLSTKVNTFPSTLPLTYLLLPPLASVSSRYSAAA